MVVGDKIYRKPVKYKISILDSETLEQVEQYNMFTPDKNVYGLVDLAYSNPYGSISQHYMEFHDPKNEMNIENNFRHGNIVLIQGSKDLSLFPLYNFGYGKIERITEKESVEGNMYYGFDIAGSAKIIYDSIGTYVRPPQYKNLKKGFANVDVKNEEYSIYNHLQRIFLTKEVLQSNIGYNLQERGNFDLAGISEKVKEVYPSISKVYQKISAIIDEFADISGCVWGVDEYNQVYFRRINDLSLGHVLKTYRNKLDDDNVTALVLDSPITRVTSTDSADGYYDVAFGFVQQSNIYDVGGNIVNYTSTYDKDICVKVKAGTSRFRNLTITVMRVGAGTDANDPSQAFLTGHIANDEDGRVGSTPVAHFWHPILEVPDKPTALSVAITTEPIDINVNDYYWIILHKKGNSQNNCLRWYHDNDIKDEYTDHWSGTRPVFARQNIQESWHNAGWQIYSHGPIYSYAFANYSRIPNIAYNPFGYNGGVKRAPVEVVYHINWIKDVYTMQKFLNLSSFTGSQQPITMQFSRVMIPNIPIRSGFTGQLITKGIAREEDGGMIGTITNVSGRMAGINDDDLSGPMGSNLCAVDFVSYKNTNIARKVP